MNETETELLNRQRYDKAVSGMRQVYWQLCLTRSVCAVLLTSLLIVGLSHRNQVDTRVSQSRELTQARASLLLAGFSARNQKRELAYMRQKLAATEAQRDEACARIKGKQPLPSSTIEPLPRNGLCGTLLYGLIENERKLQELVRISLEGRKSLSAEDARVVITELRKQNSGLTWALKFNRNKDASDYLENIEFKVNQVKTLQVFDETLRAYEAAYQKDHGKGTKPADLPRSDRLRRYRDFTKQQAELLRKSEEQDKAWAELDAEILGTAVAQEAAERSPTTTGAGSKPELNRSAARGCYEPRL